MGVECPVNTLEEYFRNEDWSMLDSMAPVEFKPSGHTNLGG